MNFRALFFLAFSFFSICNSHSQIYVNGGLSFGKWIGKIKTDEGWKDFTNYKPKLSPMFGVGYQVKTKYFNILPELNYVEYNCKFPDEIFGSHRPVSFTNRYIQLPILLKYAFINEDSLESIYFTLGPYAGLGLGSAKSTNCSTDTCVVTYTEFDVPDSFKRLDYGLQAGVGIAIKSRLALEFRYSYGLANLETSDFFIPITIQNRCINIFLKYRIL